MDRAQLTNTIAVRFLRIRNREGCDVFIQPYVQRRNAGYIFVDLDQASPGILQTMQANGHEPCLVLQTSPGHLQAWIQVSAAPLEPSIATAAGKQLAQLYGGDSASTDWRHLGRLAGFTNQKPQRRTSSGYAPWVTVLHTRPGLATHGSALLESVESPTSHPRPFLPEQFSTACVTPAATSGIYNTWLNRLRIPKRFPQPDWSIADKWIAKELLRRGMPASDVAIVLRSGSPGFPRHHFDPEDYLRRTLVRALWELECGTFPARDRPHCLDSQAAPATPTQAR